MAELSKDIVGKKMKPFSLTVEAGKVKEFCIAIGETNPIYTDIDAAKKAGYEKIPIPPTFQTSFTFWGYDTFWEDLESMNIDTKRLLHMKEEYTYHKPIYVGDVIQIQAEVVDVKVGKMNMVTMQNSMKNQNGDVCLDAIMAIVIRPEGM